MRTAIAIRGRALMHYFKPDGTHGWRVNVPNMVTYQGCNWLLDVAFRAATQSPTIYLGLITNNLYSSVVNTDTLASHPGWSEWTALAAGTRPAFAVATGANGGLLTGSTPSTFNLTADGQIRGCFLTTAAAVGSTSGGILYNTVVALTGLTVASGGTLQVTPFVRIGE